MKADKSRLIYVISNIDNSLGFEWLADQIDKTKFEVEFLFLNPAVPEIMTKLASRGISTSFIPYHGKKDIPATIFRLVRYFKQRKPDIVHCHLFDASFAGIIAARITSVPKRIYTRHHSTLHHNDHPSTVKYDKIINYFSTSIVAVSKMVSDVLITLEGVLPDKIEVIHHGFHMNQFYAENISDDRINTIHVKYNPGLKQPVIGVISRFVEWKGVQYIIPAFKRFLSDYPDAVLLLANAKGPFSDTLLAQLNELPIGSYQLIPFESDIFALYRIFDIFVHVPVSNDCEAFGQIYIESMAAGVCMICTESGVSPEVAVNRNNCMIVPYRNSDSIYADMKLLLEDTVLAGNIRSAARTSVEGRFTVKEMVDKLEVMYG